MAANHIPVHLPRALVAGDPRQFGRAPAAVAEERRWTISDDFKLFGSTFVAGFLFVTILIA